MHSLFVFIGSVFVEGEEMRRSENCTTLIEDDVANHYVMVLLKVLTRVLPFREQLIAELSGKNSGCHNCYSCRTIIFLLKTVLHLVNIVRIHEVETRTHLLLTFAP